MDADVDGEAGSPDEGEAATAAEPASPSADGSGPDAGMFYDPAYRDRLGAFVAVLLREQGPLREDRLVQAVARMHGFGRAGREIRDRVMAVLPDTSAVMTEDIGRFVWPPGTDPGSWDTFRKPALGRAADPAEMPLPELLALARQCMAPGLAEDAVLTAMRDACGLQRLRETARNRCVAALSAART